MISDKIIETITKRYEFFMVFFGIVLFLSYFWVGYYAKDELKNALIGTWYFGIVWVIIIASGAFFFLVGFFEIAFNYYSSKSIIKRELLLKKYDLDQKIKDLPKEYREELFPEKEKLKKQPKGKFF